MLQRNINDGTHSLNAKQLMFKSCNFYKPLKDNVTWGISSPRQVQIIALSMQIEQLIGGLKLPDHLQNTLKNSANKCKQRNPQNKCKGAQYKNKRKKAKKHQYGAGSLSLQRTMSQKR